MKQCNSGVFIKFSISRPPVENFLATGL